MDNVLHLLGIARKAGRVEVGDGAVVYPGHLLAHTHLLRGIITGLAERFN